MSKLRADDIPETAVIRCDVAAKSKSSTPAARAQAPADLGDRRDQIRWRCDLEVRCQFRPAAKGARWWPGRVRNLSAGGLLLLTAEPAETDVLAIEVRNRAGGIACLLFARVVHTGPAPQGGWAFGCELITRLSERQLRFLLL